MYQKLIGFMKKLHRSQKGMTGLETAIILIAFVTVASVLAYSVLSAGIFSAERGKETVYSGLKQAESSLEVKGAVIGYSADNVKLSTLTIKLALANPSETVDKSAIALSFYSINMTEQMASSEFTLTKVTNSPERGSTGVIEGDEVWELTVTIPATATIRSYDWCTIQVIPPTGASLSVKRVMPGYLDTYMTLQ